jgi:O-acetyl-ADP-ribose deacetylase (regulator of RNase III)
VKSLVLLRQKLKKKLAKMIRFVKGDFFDFDADIRINTVNCVGVMGAGVALLFKNKFPDMFKDYYRACENKEVKPGKPHVWHEKDMFSKTTIINFPTKVHWKNPSKYEYIEKGLIWLKEYLLDKNESTLTLPALGCGHGGLDWEKVKILIQSHLSDINTNILVFEPSDSTNTNISKEIQQELEEQDIHRLLPSDKNYPTKLIGRSAQEIFYKGNIELVNSKNIAIVVNSKPEEREKKALQNFIDEFPIDEFTFLLGYSNSHEIDIARTILSKGFKVIITVPYGLLQLKVRRDLQEFWNYKQIVLLSTTKQNQSWKGYESVNSLKFRLKLANITLINSLNYEKFTSFEKDIKLPENKLFYVSYWNNQVDFFNRLKARKLGINPETKKANIIPILETLKMLCSIP